MDYSQNPRVEDDRVRPSTPVTDDKIKPSLQDTDSKTQPALQKLMHYIIISFAVLLPIFVVPSASAPIALSKTLLVFTVVFILFILFIIFGLRRAVVTIPRHLVLLAAWLIPFLYLVSAVLSESIGNGIFGSGFETDTVLFVTAGALLVTIVAITTTSHEKILRFFPALLLSALVLAVFQIVRVFAGPDFLALGVLNDSVTTLLGRWVDTGIFFGLIVILSLLALGGMNLHRWPKIFLYVTLITALFFVALINFFPVWVVLALFSLGLVTYGYFKKGVSEKSDIQTSLTHEGLPAENSSEIKSDGKKGAVSVLAGAVLVLSVFFIIWGDVAGTAVSSTFNVSYIEARPSWVSTVEVVRDTYKDNLLLGSGPNTFVKQWASFRPEAVNLSNFWNVDFTAGIGVIPTSFVTSGLLGGLAWLVFFALILIAGVKALIMKPSENKVVYITTLASFVGAVYLWTFSILYVAGTVLLTLAFLMTGLFVASLRGQLNIRVDRKVVLGENPRLGFVTSLSLIVLLLVSVSVVYMAGTRFVAGMDVVRSQSALAEGNTSEAGRQIVKAIALHDSASSYRLSSAVGLARLAEVVNDTALSQSDKQTLFRETLSTAVKNAKLSTETDSGDYRNWLSLAQVYGSVVPFGIEGAYENAVRSYEKVIELAPRHPLPHLALAQIEAARGNIEESRRFITAALELKANYTAAVFLLSQIETASGNIENAVASTQAMTILDPTNPVFFFQLGLLQYNLGDNEAAAEAFSGAIDLNSDYANARYFLGLTFARQGDASGSIQQFEAVLSLNPGNEDVLKILNNLREGRGPLEEADGEEASEGLRSGIDELPISGE